MKAGTVTVAISMPKWLSDEVDQAVERRLSNRSAVIREALLAWLSTHPEEKAS